MVIFLRMIISLSLAQEPQWLLAKNAGEVIQILEHEQKQKTLQERCRIELRQNWLPRFCFEMLEHTSMSNNEKLRLEQRFRQHCTHVVQKMRRQGETGDWIFKNPKYLLLKCDSSLQELYKDYFYQKEHRVDGPLLEKTIEIPGRVTRG